MGFSAIVAGTGFEGRAARIRMFAHPGDAVELRREPDNPYDENAVAVYLRVRRWYTLFRPVPLQIGYLKKARAASLSKKMAEGVSIREAVIVSTYKADKHPRVSLKITTDE
ncbi:HIRAN domain-containing protein [Halomonas sp. EGI 63088]|uniref:HIRAN domain-containing protein n=1 Tax=Halomonas flagellata TaxID=2920385 RepID=A0ABS9RU55_9GAMM|nr:HIRAN domain-containing protein [Halomonas flagellata]MCH4563339.1 HIRAN domain-containing protein [Halomonas flagellata]